MKEFDIIVIGGGAGLKIAGPAAGLGYKVAVIEKDALGGTCLNRGCIPSKMLIHPADVATEIKTAKKFGINIAGDFNVDFEQLVKRVNETISHDSQNIEKRYSENPNITFYKKECKFVAEKVLEIKGEQENITAPVIFIAVGARPQIPAIPGLATTPFMTSTDALVRQTLPKKLVVIGGGYIGAELGHYFGALGTEVHVLVRTRMLNKEDTDIVDEFESEFSKQYNVYFGTTPELVTYNNGTFSVSTKNRLGTASELTGDALLVATGIVPNSDTLNLEAAGIKTNPAGFIEVNDKLCTSQPGVYAFGDIIGKNLFRHAANFEAEYLFDAIFKNKTKTQVQQTVYEPNYTIKYPPMPHAVFSYPQVAGVGVTEDKLKANGLARGKDYVVGVARYKETAMGMALMVTGGLVKLLFDRNSHKLIGAHIVGAEGSNMIHMPIAFMSVGATLEQMANTIYIHPALPEVVRNAVRRAKQEFDLIK